MLSNFEHLTAAELQQHGAALRALGCSLLGRDDADDLVQESWLAALQAPSARHLGGWLVGTVRRLAASRRRAEVRRRRREQVVATPEAVPAVVDTVAQAEVMHRVAAEVVSLNEPYRTAVVLRFWHGLSPRQLAARLSVPVDTARSRVQRGVALLRARLSRDSGNAWVVPLAAVIDGAAKSGLPTAGAVVRSASWWQSLFLLAAGTTVATLLLLVYVADPTQAAATVPTVATGPVAGDAGVNARQQSVDVVERTAVAIPDRTELRLQDGVLVVRLCAAGTATPLVGYGVGLRRAGPLHGQERESKFTPTDERGQVVFPGLAPTSWVIEVDRIGNVVIQQVEADKHQERLVEVAPGVTVTGTVVDARGQPAPGAVIVVHGSRIGLPPTIATCDESGHYRVEHVGPDVALLAMMPGRVQSLAQVVAGEQGSTMEMQLRLGDDEGRRLDGRAFDASGEPLVGAVVAVLPAAVQHVTLARDKPQVRALWLRTDAGGRFTSNQVAAGRHVVFAEPGNPHVAPCWGEADTTAGDAFVELRSAAGATVVGTVCQRGEPVSGVLVSAWPERTPLQIGYLLNLFGQRHATTGADGAYCLDSLVPGKHALSATRGTVEIGSATIEVAAERESAWDLDLGAEAALRVRLQPATAAVQHQPSAWVRKSKADGGATLVVPFAPDGTALLLGPRSSSVDVVVAIAKTPREYFELARRRSVPPSATEVTIELRLQDLPVRKVQGRLIDANGAPVTGAIVAVQRQGDTHPFVRCAVVTSADGGFDIGPLPVGSYTVSVGEVAHAHEVAKGVLVLADRDTVLGDVRDRGQ